MTLGRSDDARAVLQETIGLVETGAGPGSTGADLLASWAASTGVPFLSSTGAGLLESLAQIYRDGGEFEQSRQYLEQALELAEKAGIPGRTGWALLKLSGLAFLLGYWPDARAYFERASRIFGLADAASYCRLHVAQLGLAEGDVEKAAESLETIIRRADSRRDLWLVRQAQRLLAERDLLDGRPESALARLEPLVDRPGLQEPQVTALMPLLAWAHLQLGDELEAEEILTRCLERARAQNHRLATADAIRIRGMLRTQQSKWKEAFSDFDEVTSLAKSMPYPYAEAQALYQSGMTHVRRRGLLEWRPATGQAREHLQNALAIFQRLGARPYVERTEQALRAVSC
jgi:tetratricopeptide (TPR) repeat protein